MRLTKAPLAYAKAEFDKIIDQIERALNFAHTRGQDVEMAKGRLILTDEDTGERYRVFIASGVLDYELMP